MSDMSTKTRVILVLVMTLGVLAATIGAGALFLHAWEYQGEGEVAFYVIREWQVEVETSADEVAWSGQAGNYFEGYEVLAGRKLGELVFYSSPCGLDCYESGPILTSSDVVIQVREGDPALTVSAEEQIVAQMYPSAEIVSSGCIMIGFFGLILWILLAWLMDAEEIDLKKL